MADKAGRHEERLSGEGAGDNRTDGGRNSSRSMVSVVERARRDLEDLLGHPVERVTGATREEDGWRLTVDVLELERVPDSTSVLGSYDVSVDREGEIRGYERIRRFYRNRTDEEEL
jgi:hypothetical protein